MPDFTIITKYDGFELKNKDWIKFLNRDLSLFILYYASYSYIGNIKDFGAVPLEEAVYTSKKGIADIWRPEEKQKESIRSVQNIIKKDSEFIFKTFKELDIITKTTEEFCKKKFNKMSKKNKIAFLDKLDKIIKRYMRYFIFLVFFGYGFEEEYRLKYPQITKIYEKIRQSNLFRPLERVYLRFGSLISRDEGYLVIYLTPLELKEMIIKNESDLTLAKERYNGYFMYCIGKKRYILTGESMERGIKELMSKTKKVRIPKEIKGILAYQGIIRGVVLVALNEKEFKNIKDDCILVTHMTTPWLIPYMEKVKGVITDEGGLGCHAAILARERKVPCIVGTKNATEVLKTGDEIELDAFKGEVRIIKRAK